MAAKPVVLADNPRSDAEAGDADAAAAAADPSTIGNEQTSQFFWVKPRKT